MTSLQRLEHDILQLNGRITLRPTLDLARSVGEKLVEAKSMVPHGQWIDWLKRVYLPRRTAQIYMSIAKSELTALSTLTIEQFLRQIRLAKRRASVSEREASRAEAIERQGVLPEGIEIHHADCAKFGWPTLDLICTDPPWKDLASYDTLADIAVKHLKPGGLLLVQCGVTHIAKVIESIAPLTYRHTLAIVYGQAQGNSMLHPFQGNWRPVLVFSKGVWRKQGLPAMSDTFTMGRATKKYHEWEQPAAPFGYWLSRLAKPGDLVGDPFAGSATIGHVCKANGLRYVGTEIDEAHFRVARGRLSECDFSPSR